MSIVQRGRSTILRNTRVSQLDARAQVKGRDSCNVYEDQVAGTPANRGGAMGQKQVRVMLLEEFMC